MKRFIVEAKSKNLMDAFLKDCQAFNPEWRKIEDGQSYLVFKLEDSYGEALRYAAAYFGWKNAQRVELKPPQIGKLAIFWDNEEGIMLIDNLVAIRDGSVHPFVSRRAGAYRHAALFEGQEHFDRFINQKN